MPYKKKPKTELKLFIKSNGKQHYVGGLVDPAPTVFESSTEVEVRFNVEVGYNSIEVFSHYEGETIGIGLEYPDMDVTISTEFTVGTYERRFGNSKGPIVTHVLRGNKP